MNQIKCPNCQTEFTIDEDQYADILGQVKSKEFAKELDERMQQLKDQQESENNLYKERLFSDSC